MKKRSENSPTRTRSRMLLARLDDWVAACHRVIQKRWTGKQRGPGDNWHQESGTVRTITEVVAESFRMCFAPGSRPKASTDRIDYLDRVLDGLGGVISDPDRQETTSLADRLHQVLMQLNFNARPYCLSYIAQINDRVRAENTLEQKIDVLDEYQKFVAQLQCERGMMYYDLYPNVKEFIGGWIFEEISFMERKAARFNDKSHQSGEYLNSGLPAKVMLNTSVARLACVTRVLVERGIIQNNNISDLSLLLSRFIITRRTENASARSFRLRYYDIEDSTRDSVIKTLRDLVHYIETMGGE